MTVVNVRNKNKNVASVRDGGPTRQMVQIISEVSLISDMPKDKTRNNQNIEGE